MSFFRRKHKNADGVTAKPIEAKPQRWRVVYISAELLIDLVSVNRYIQVESKLPKDVKVVRAFVDRERSCIGLVIEHESFDKIKPGEKIPTFDNPTMFSRVNLIKLPPNVKAEVKA